MGGDLSPAAGGGGVRLERGDKQECFFRSQLFILLFTQFWVKVACKGKGVFGQ